MKFLIGHPVMVLAEPYQLLRNLEASTEKVISLVSTALPQSGVESFFHCGINSIRSSGIWGAYGVESASSIMYSREF